jgi:hypothetical protein
VKTLTLSATLAALVLSASTACAGVMDFGNGLGPSGGYTSQAYYQAMLGGQPMTAAQQAYGDQEDQLRQLGFRSELGGDIALGQMFYRMAYGMTPPPSAPDSVSGGSGLGPSSIPPSGLAAGSSDGGAAGSSDAGDAGSFDSSTTGGDVGLGLVGSSPSGPGGFSVVAVPEASTWAMMLFGFGSLGYAGWRGSRKPALHSV